MLYSETAEEDKEFAVTCGISQILSFRVVEFSADNTRKTK
jgi:hypothetical protein